MVVSKIISELVAVCNYLICSPTLNRRDHNDFLIKEAYLILSKCYTGKKAGDQIVTIFELYISV